MDAVLLDALLRFGKGELTDETLENRGFLAALYAAGFTSGGELTSKGKKTIAALEDRILLLFRGIPLSEREPGDPDALIKSPEINRWFRLALVRDPPIYYPDTGHLILSSKPSTHIEYIDANEDTERARILIKRWQKAIDISGSQWAELIPYAYQRDGLLGKEIIALQTKRGDFRTMIQAKFYDFVLANAKKPRFFTVKKKNHAVGVYVKSATSRPNSIFALIAPLVRKSWAVSPIELPKEQSTKGAKK
jgi:hypothetical protein